MVLNAPREWALFNFKQLRRGEEEERHLISRRSLNKKSIFEKLKQTKKRKPEEIGVRKNRVRKKPNRKNQKRNRSKSSESDEINEVRDNPFCEIIQFYDNKYGIFDAASLIYYSDVHTDHSNHITVY